MMFSWKPFSCVVKVVLLALLLISGPKPREATRLLNDRKLNAAHTSLERAPPVPPMGSNPIRYTPKPPAHH
ncbi:hypothetical protein QQP08_014350 [Theobroma cacao]|uniref:Uncharacterized protein n=1 Tax=Theobroma cacao TaxID=3641 RepID=A0A061EU16_THECC|nr:Uncharacterized protein TCM_020682 [Theobroma cacao]WRX21863.1 hypothetical protein QQP08_014350 [Theobroma cacao]